MSEPDFDALADEARIHWARCGAVGRLDKALVAYAYRAGVEAAAPQQQDEEPREAFRCNQCSEAISAPGMCPECRRAIGRGLRGSR